MIVDAVGPAGNAGDQEQACTLAELVAAGLRGAAGRRVVDVGAPS